MAALTQALFVLRIVSPAVVLLSGLTVIPSRAPPPPPSQITPVVVKTQTPRRALILSFLSLASLSFLADGLAFVVYAVLDKYWPKYSAIEISAILGIIAYSGLAALGAYKDIKGVDVWSFRSIKFAVALALAVDIATVVLQGISFTEGESEHTSSMLLCLHCRSHNPRYTASRVSRVPCTFTRPSRHRIVQPPRRLCPRQRISR